MSAQVTGSSEQDVGALAPDVDRHWAYRYRIFLTVIDSAAIVSAVAVATVLFFDDPDVRVAGSGLSYELVSVGLALAWIVALAIGRTRDRRVLGFGAVEYQRVVGVSWRLFAVVAVASYLMKWQVGRGYLLVAAPVGAASLVVGRYLVRQALRRTRAQGLAKSTVLVVGPAAKAATLIEEFHHEPSAEFQVVGVCLPAGEQHDGASVRGVPVLGSMDDAGACARGLRVRTVAVAGADRITSAAVRRLGWDLEGSGIDLALTTTLIDVAGPRVLMRPMNSLPLLYVDEPRFSGPKFVAKSAMDWVTAAFVAALISPVLLGLAIAVRVTSPGPVFFVQQRIGLNGRPFGMIKFRSMVVGAADRLAAVLAAEGIDEVGAFYKPKNDPRVTPLGRFIRRYSLDELPQLFNVLRGEMSLVGPRPQIADEVATYDRTAHRRLLVKPGLTGLWQVSGRSALSPEQAIRLDVRYVENWSIFGDLAILMKTAKAMVTGDGAR